MQRVFLVPLPRLARPVFLYLTAAYRGVYLSPAKKELERINKEGQITGQDIDWTDMGNDEETGDVEDGSTEKSAGSGNS